MQVQVFRPRPLKREILFWLPLAVALVQIWAVSRYVIEGRPITAGNWAAFIAFMGMMTAGIIFLLVVRRTWRIETSEDHIEMHALRNHQSFRWAEVVHATLQPKAVKFRLKDNKRAEFRFTMLGQSDREAFIAILRDRLGVRLAGAKSL